MTELRVTVADGKYTIVMPETGGLHCLRYGEEWRSLTGDGMVLAMAYEIDDLRDALRRIQTIHDEKLATEWIPVGGGKVPGYPDDIADACGEHLSEIAEICEEALR